MMALLTQARLVPQSQRCLAVSWRIDVQERLAIIYNLNPVSQSMRAINNVRETKIHAIQNLENIFDYNTPISNHKTIARKSLSLSNTPRSLTKDDYYSKTKALVTDNPISRLNNDILNLDSYRGMNRHQFKHQQCKSKFSFKEHLQKFYGYLVPYCLLSKTNQTISEALTNPFERLAFAARSSLFKQRKKTALTFTANEWFQFDHNYKSFSGQGNDSYRSNCNSRLFRNSLITFGFLGMFRRPSEEELEEERVRLEDEQKIKKMKPVELAIAKGVLSMCDQNYGKANQLFHEALHMAQDENDEEKENLILNLIASNYFESGDYINAEKLFIDLMKSMIALNNVAPTSPPILELSLKLASIYSKNPQTQEKALKGFKFVISSLLSNLDEIANDIKELDIQQLSDDKKDELALLGWGYDWFAKHLLIMNDYNGAANMLQKAHEISSKVLGPLHDQTLILLNDIGTTLAMNNSPDEGRAFIKSAVEGAIINESKELASFYVNLGLVNLKLRNLDEAKKSCEYSIDLAKKNPEHYNSHEIIELSRTCLNQIRLLLETEKQ